MYVRISNKLKIFLAITITLLSLIAFVFYLANKKSEIINVNGDIDNKLIARLAFKALKDNKVVLEEQELNSILNYVVKASEASQYVKGVMIKQKGKSLVLYFLVEYLGKSFIISSNINLYIDEMNDKIMIEFLKFKIGDLIVPRTVGLYLIKNTFSRIINLKDGILYIPASKYFNFNGNNIKAKLTGLKCIDGKYDISFNIEYNLKGRLLNK